MPAFDYSPIHDVYDSYCTFTGDVRFWVDVAARDGGVLELMAGTGRISLPLFEAGIKLTCVEQSWGMASVLARKAAGARVVCGDVLALPIRERFRQVLLPFQGLSELVTQDERALLFREVAARLAKGGTFICTAHNPAVRTKTLNGAWQTIGTFPHGDGTVEVRVRGTVEGETATGEQRVIVRDAAGNTTRDHELPLRFSLPPLAEILELAAAAGLRTESVFGGYDRSDWDEAQSPAIIGVFVRL